MIKKLALGVLIILALISCDNPVQAGLGTKVDITPPTLSMVGPSVGGFIKGADSILEVNAQDDIGVSKVQVSFLKLDEAGKEIWSEWADAKLDPESSNWKYPLDTTGYPDGPLSTRIQAVDDTGKATLLPDLVFNVKNNPPTIELQIPAWGDPKNPDPMELVTGGKLIGLALDPEGVGPLYPKIKFWSDKETEPADWVSLGKDFDTTEQRKTALEFRYDLKDEKGGPLTEGLYHFKFAVADKDGPDDKPTEVSEHPGVAVYPGTGKGWEDWNAVEAWYDVTLIQSLEFPTIKEVQPDPPGAYQGVPFNMTAKVGHSSGIHEAYFTFQKDGEKETYMLEALQDTNQIMNEGALFPLYEWTSGLITPGKKIAVKQVIDPKDPKTWKGLEYSFEDGAYDFALNALSKQGSEAFLGCKVYIDIAPPEVAITRIQPVVKEAIAAGIPTYTVNGVITADISVFDANNIGQKQINDTIAYREIKYLFLTTNPSDVIDPKALYEDAAAKFFDQDDTSNSKVVYRNPDSNASIFIDTTKLSGKNHFYLIAKDSAGNYGYVRNVLDVDQGTDKPVIKFTSVSEKMQDPALLWTNEGKPNVLGAKGEIAGILTDDDAIDPESVKVRYWKGSSPTPPETGVLEKPLRNLPAYDYLTVSNDKKTVQFAIDKTFLEAEDGGYFFEIEFKDDKSGYQFPAAISGSKDPVSGGTDLPICVLFASKPPEIVDPQFNGGIWAINNYATDKFSFTFTAKDDNFLDMNDMGVGLDKYSSLIVKRDGKDLKVGTFDSKTGITTAVDPATGITTTIKVEENSKKEWIVTVTETVTSEKAQEGKTYLYEIGAGNLIDMKAAQPFTVTVDVTPPEVDINRIQPATKEEKYTGEDGKEHIAYDVNGVVSTNISANDPNNIGTDEDGNREIKYIILDKPLGADGTTPDGKTLDDLYNDKKAGFFDKGDGSVVYTDPNARDSIFIDTTKLPGDEPQYIYIIAKDSSGNYGYEESKLNADQGGDVPQILFTSIKSSVQTVDLLWSNEGKQNILDNTAGKIAGILTDDDAIDPESVIFRYWDAANVQKERKLLPGELTISADQKTAQFNINQDFFGVKDGIYAVKDGIYFFEMEFKDTKDNSKFPAELLLDADAEARKAVSFNTSTDGENPGKIYFVFASAPPEIDTLTLTKGTQSESLLTSKGTVRVQNNYAQKTYSFTFTATDITALDWDATPKVSTTDLAKYTSLTIKRNGIDLIKNKPADTTITLNKDNTIKQWNIEVSQAKVPDGTYQYEISVANLIHKADVKSFSVTVDTTAPTVGITRIQPAVEEDTDNGITTYTVNGVVAADINAFDANNFDQEKVGNGTYRSIKYLITKTPPSTTGVDAKALYSDPNAGYVDQGDLTAGKVVYKNSNSNIYIDTKELDDAEYQFYLIAKDSAGNYSYARSVLDVDQDTDTPTIQFNTIHPEITQDTLLSSAGKGNMLDSDEKITGVLADDDAIDPDSVILRYWSVDDPTIIEKKYLRTSTYNYLTVSDDQKTAQFAVDREFFGDKDATYAFEIEFKDKKTAKLPDSYSGNSNDSVPGGTGSPIYFLFASGPPELGDSQFNGEDWKWDDDINKYAQDEYTFSFTAKDDNFLDMDATKDKGSARYPGLVIKRDGKDINQGVYTPVSGGNSETSSYTDPDTGITTTITVEKDSGKEWTVTVAETGATDNKTHQYEIGVSNGIGNTATKPFIVTVDTKQPEVEITRVHPAVGEGTYKDANDKEHTEYEVNGVVSTNISANDPNGIGTDSDGNREIKYIILDAPLGMDGKTPDGKTLDDLYNDKNAGFFDKGDGKDSNPKVVYTDPNAKDSIFIDTTQLNGEKYVYIIAKDSSGNYGYEESKLKVDQNGDKPRVEFTSIGKVLTEADLWTPAGRKNVLDEKGQIAGILTDDDAIDPTSVKFRYWRKSVALTAANEDNAVETITLSADKLTVSNDKKTVRFEFDQAYLGTKAVDGIYYFELEVSDSKADGKFPDNFSDSSEAKKAVSCNTSTDGENPGKIFFVFASKAPEITTLKLEAKELLTAEGLIQNNYAPKTYSFTFTAKDENALAMDKAKTGLAQYTGLTIKRNGNNLINTPVPDITITPKVGNTEKEWTITVTGTDVPDGTYQYEISVENLIRKAATRSFTVTVDVTPPDISITRPPTMVSNEGMDFVIADPTLSRSDNVNGVIRFAAGALDDNGISGIKWFLIKEDTDKTTFESDLSADIKALYSDLDPRGTSFDKANPSVLVDTTKLDDQKEYSLYIMARDNAGNIGYTDTPTTFYVDQRTDKPVILLSNLDQIGGVVSNSFKLTGTVKDDDGVDTTKLKLSLSNDGGSHWWNGDNWESTMEVLLAPTITGVGKQVIFDYNFPNFGADGANKRVVITASDDFNAKEGTAATGANAVKDATLSITFAIDNTSPVITVDATVPTTQKGNFTLNGNITEVNLKTFNARVDALDWTSTGSELTVTSTSAPNHTWTYAVGDDFDLLSEGPHTITLEAVDKVGLTQTVQWTFYKDTKAPVISFNNLNQEIYLSDLLFKPYGDLTAPEKFAVAVEVEFTPTGTSPSWASGDDAGLQAKIAEKLAAAKTTLAGFIIRDTDPNLKGNFADEWSDVGTFKYRFDTDPHDVTDTGYNDPDKTMWRTGTVTQGKNISWNIRIPDPGTLSGLASADPVSYPLNDGLHRITIRVTDVNENDHTTNATPAEKLNGNGIKTDIAFILDRAAPEVSITSTDPSGIVYSTVGYSNDTDVVFNLTGTATDANLTTLTYKIGTGNVTNFATLDSPWSIPVTKAAFTSLSEGTTIITVTATDISSRVTSIDWSFVKDTAAPVIDFLNMTVKDGSDAWINSATAPYLFGDSSAKILGTAADTTSGISGVTYTLVKKNGTVWSTSPEAVKTDEPLTLNGSNWNIILGAGGLGLGDGDYRIAVTAKDNAKKKGGGSNDNPNTVTNPAGAPPAETDNWVYFTLDTAPPELVVPVETKSYYNSDIALLGTASDANGILNVRAELRNSGGVIEGTLVTQDSDTGYGSAWPLDGTVTSWKTAITIPDAITTGSFTINVVATDRAGHETAITRNITIDRIAPYPDRLVITEPQTNTTVGGSSYARVIGKVTVRGRAEDNNSIDKIYYQIGKGDSAEIGDNLAKDSFYTIAALGSGFDWVAAGAPQNVAVGTFFKADWNGADTTKLLSGGATVYRWKDSQLDGSDPATEIVPTTVTWSGGVHSYTVQFNEVTNYATAEYGSQRYRYTADEDDALVAVVDGDSDTTQTSKTDVWKLPINILALDVAGNATSYNYAIIVDKYLDKSTSQVLSPDSKNPVGGQVRLSGTSTDNTMINSVWVRVTGSVHGGDDGAALTENWDLWTDWEDATTTTQANDNVTQTGWWNWATSGQEPEVLNTLTAPGEVGTILPSTKGWHKATITTQGSTANWYINLNANGKLNPTGAATERIVYVQVFARDTKADNSLVELDCVNGYVTNYKIKFSNNVPLIQNVKVAPSGFTKAELHDNPFAGDYADPYSLALDYQGQMQIGKTVEVRADVSDTDGITQIRIKNGVNAGQIQIFDTVSPVMPPDGVTVTPFKIIKPVANGKNESNQIRMGYKYLVVTEGDFSAFGRTGASMTFTATANGTIGSGMLYEANDAGTFVYTVSIILNTEILFPFGKTGTHTITLYATDFEAPAQNNLQELSFQIDNSFPRPAYTAQVNAVGLYTLRGNVTDVPDVGGGGIQGLKQVKVYFQRKEWNGSAMVDVWYMPKGAEGSDPLISKVSSAQTTISARRWKGVSGGGLDLGFEEPASITYPALDPLASPSSNIKGWGITIDKDESSSGADTDRDGFVEYWQDDEFQLGARRVPGKIWGALFPTVSLLPDGKTTIWFVAEDSAGNVSYSTSEIFVRNNPPSLSNLKLGTALYGTTVDTVNGTSAIGESRYTTNTFVVRNNTFRINVDATGGNQANYWRARYVTRNAEHVKHLVEGELYTIVRLDSQFDFTSVGGKNTVGESFISTATRDIPSSSDAYVNSYATNGYTQKVAGESVNAGDIIDYPGDTDWTLLTGHGAPWLPGTVLNSGPIPPNTTGTAISGNTHTVKAGSFISGQSGNIDFTTSDFVFPPASDQTKIPDSSYGSTPEDPISKTNDRYFLIKVYDVTDNKGSAQYATAATEGNQLSDFILFAVRIENMDRRKPTATLYDFSPYAESDNSDAMNLYQQRGVTTTLLNPTLGGLFDITSGNVTKKSGHIEPRDISLTGDGLRPAAAQDQTNYWLEAADDTGSKVKPTGFTRDTLSGSVIIRGSAYDDQLITAIWLNLGGTPVQILETNTVTANGRLQIKGLAGQTKTDDISVYDTLNLNGHNVEWAYKWDTSTTQTGVANNVSVRVISQDKTIHSPGDYPDPESGGDSTGAHKQHSEEINNGPGGTTYGPDGNGGTVITGVGRNIEYNRIAVDLAPYINTLVRYTSVDATTAAPELRSKNGWYSFRRSKGPAAADNERFTVEGFNLYNGTNPSTIAIKEVLVTTGTQYNGTTPVPAITYGGKTKLESYIPNGALSGKLTVKAGPAAIEAVNNRNNNDNSWNSEKMAGNTATLQWNDDRYVHIFDSHNNGPATNATNLGYFRPPTGNGAPKRPQMTINPSDGILYAGFSTYIINSTTSNFNFYYSSNTGATAAGYAGWTNNDPHEDVAVTWDSTSSGTRPVILQYDNYNAGATFYGGLRYFTAAAGSGVNAANSTGTSWVTNSNATDNRMIDQFSYLNTVNNGKRNYSTWYDAKHGLGFATADPGYTGLTNTAQTNGQTKPYADNAALLVASTTGTGKYNAVDYLKTGTASPVVVYQYVAANGTETIRYAYANKTNPGGTGTPTAADWTIPTTDIPGTTNGGRYLSMKIGSDNTMHIAYMDSEDGDLKYLKGTRQANGSYTFATPVTVDSVGNVGKWTDIALAADGSPIISYLDQGGIDSRTGLKMAIYDNALYGTNGGNGWEHVTLPGRYAVEDVRTQVECDTRGARTWDAAFAYVSGNYYRLSYYVK